MSWTGRIFWLLAFEEVEGLRLSVEQRETRLRPSTLNPQTLNQPSPFSRLHRWKDCGRHARPDDDWLMGNRIQLQQRNCSGFTPDFSRRSTWSNSQRTDL